MNATPPHRRIILVYLACICTLFANVPGARSAGHDPALATPDLLVDLARDYGLRRRGKQTPADALYVRTLLQAALRLDPKQSQACTLLYELAARGDRPQEAAEMLAQLVASDPTNITAWSNWLESGPTDVQTAEERRAWLEGLLAEQELPQRRALVLTHLARLALQQADRVQARRRLDEALDLWPECPDALVFGLQLVTPETPPAERLYAALQALQANPLRVELAWNVALLLDECGLAEKALTFYQHALSVHAAAGSREALPVGKLLDLSRNAVARGEREEALHYAQRAAASESQTYEARFYLCWLAGVDAQTGLRDGLKSTLAADFARVSDPADWPVGIVSQAAWFYCLIDEQPQRALLLAKDAARRATGDPFVTRVLGWAQALNGQDTEAQQTLAPIAKTDPYAAYRLAKLLRDAGDQDAPARLVHELDYVPPVGPARELLDQLGVLPTGSQPAEQRFPEVVKVLARFDRTVLDFYKDPSRFLEAKVELEDSEPMPGEPWWAVFSLTNRGSFPITLGPEWMVNPVFLLSFHVTGDHEHDYPDLFTVSIDYARVIQPAETVRVRRTIDIGPPRKISQQAPQHLETISLSAILDPRQTFDGQWQPSASGQTLHEVSFVRLPAENTPAAWQARFSEVKGESPPTRFRALEVMAELLGEKQRADLKRLTYRPEPIPAERIHATLLGALESGSWETRVRTLDALQVAGLDRPLVDAAEGCLAYPHWLVRMMAVRLLARQGKAFAETARRIAANDEDDLVRALARSYVERWSPRPATQPAAP